jgi:hypothetical protein
LGSDGKWKKLSSGRDPLLLEQLQAEQYTLVPPGLSFFVLDIAINAKTSEVIRVLQIDFIEA